MAEGAGRNALLQQVERTDEPPPQAQIQDWSLEEGKSCLPSSRIPEKTQGSDVKPVTPS